MPRARKTNRADGRFEIKRTVGKDADGKAIRKSFYGKNEAEALREYQAYLDDRERKRQASRRTWKGLPTRLSYLPLS